MVTLRLVGAKLDVSQITSMYKTFVLNTPITFESVPPDELNMLERISKVTRHYPWLVCELDGDISWDMPTGALSESGKLMNGS